MQILHSESKKVTNGILDMKWYNELLYLERTAFNTVILLQECSSNTGSSSVQWRSDVYAIEYRIGMHVEALSPPHAFIFVSTLARWVWQSWAAVV